MDPSAARNDFERALVRPKDAVVLWREMPYELFVDGVWQSGQFDRVVFTESGGERSATIFDFKTNGKRAGETDEAFAKRMRETYAGQMLAYRAALSAIAGIPQERIGVKLLLSATMAAVELPPPLA